MDLSSYQRIKIDPWVDTTLSDAQRKAIAANINLCRDAIVFFTACGSASGYGGHTGGAFDTVPEVMLLDAMFRVPRHLLSSSLFSSFLLSALLRSTPSVDHAATSRTQ